jgi:hypothetical protein
MPSLDINLNCDGAWPDLAICPPDKIFRTSSAKLLALEGGMQSGLPAVMLRIDLPGGMVAIYETSAAQFLMAAQALRGRFPELDVEVPRRPQEHSAPSAAPAGGLIGKKNQYYCVSCRRAVVTVDRDDGVTPMLIPCQFGCKAVMHSAFYKVNQDLPATHEWYRPGEEELKNASPAMRDHVSRGGLDIRKIGG